MPGMAPAARDPVVEHFAANVRRFREKRGLTQQRLAERLGADLRWIQRIEAGERDVSISSLSRIARALKVRPAYLLRKAQLRSRAPGRPKGPPRPSPKKKRGPKR